MSEGACWHCLLKDLKVEWRPSVTHPKALAGYVFAAKVCAVFYRGGSMWEGKGFFVLGDQYPAKVHYSREAAEWWCVEQVRLWFGQLDHD
ncbi:hypothetical protein ACWEN6_24930 [Sphaerisporangium sp. NPDC004334]